MKKFLLTILALVYLASSIGATVYRHYCMDKLVSWGVVGQEKEMQRDCSYCGMPRTGNAGHCSYQVRGCCHDEHQQVKIEKDQKIVEGSVKLVKPSSPIITHSQAGFSSVIVQTPVIAYPVTHAPPQTGKVALFIRNCVFRI